MCAARGSRRQTQSLSPGAYWACSRLQDHPGPTEGQDVHQFAFSDDTIGQEIAAPEDTDMRTVMLGVVLVLLLGVPSWANEGPVVWLFYY